MASRRRLLGLSDRNEKLMLAALCQTGPSLHFTESLVLASTA
jgi:hypothetical protein